MSEVKVQVHPESPLVEVRTGSALPLANPLPTIISGNIDTPVLFSKRRSKLIDEKSDCSHVLVNMKKKSIALVIDEQNPHNHYKITGQLALSDQVKTFNLNGSKMIRAELIQLLKKHKFYFVDKDEYAIVLQSIEKFSAKIQKEIEQSSDKVGNSTSFLKYTSSWGEGRWAGK